MTTGYRWYLVERFHLPTLFRSAWNASVVSMLADHNRNFAWGGSMAMRRETFEDLKILEAWEGSVSDDYAVTCAAEKAGAKIVFVPECLVPSYGVCTWRELAEFTTRQIIITRVYHPRLWRIGLLGHIIFNIAFWSMLIVQPQIAAVLFLLAMWKAAVRLLAVQTVLPDPALFKFSWFYILSPPLVALIYLYNMIRSALGTDIVWRQIHYKLISPNKTHVVGGSGAAES
ncbi:MAG: glycosyltransferase family 2 protein [Acidobacteria bacterium]|nr:glycosyltransferase family 2 protein [Acidobacteriota bacterium]